MAWNRTKLLGNPNPFCIIPPFFGKPHGFDGNTPWKSELLLPIKELALNFWKLDLCYF